MKFYRDEPILASLNGRLVPPDKHYPDCQCKVILTELNLYVLEYNYDNTYIEHFSIPIDDVLHIKCMESVVLDSGAMGYKPESRGLWRFLRMVGSALSAFEDGERLPFKLVRIRYRAEGARESSLDFKGEDSPRRMARQLEKHRERWGLNYQTPNQTP
ncbi:MAG: hypothetical protein FWD25_10540 [Clostridia bacterium]|nr:hypothetical protein [Clostridia bacterium]